jgi:hypothetical protein
VHGAPLRESLAAFVRDARAQSVPLPELRRALTLLVRDCARAPANDRAGVTEYVLRRAALLYEEVDLGLLGATAAAGVRD